MEEWPCLEILRGASIHVARERNGQLDLYRVLANRLRNVGISFLKCV